ncbi:hypothetical protein [Dryocola sp. BD613]|uniref:hypothetical protein n=1 Tax=Dryocola sp. BD613 TaxID=3133272 RepID=UPI003F4F9D2C
MQYATRGIVEPEALLLVDVQESVWPAMVYPQIESAGGFPAQLTLIYFLAGEYSSALFISK